MNRSILWIEDDYHAIKGLMRQLKKAKVSIDSASCAIEGYEKAQHWQDYDLIVLDLILPLTNGHTEELPALVKSWKDEPHVGIGILKWLRRDLKVKCPVILLSVVQNPVVAYHLEDIKPEIYLPKHALLPADVKQQVLSLLAISG
jgi:CheY-like chemotaxis protein